MSNMQIEHTNAKGQFHMVDGPAVVWRSGTKEWYINGKRHRISGPAVEGYNGYKEWWVNGLFHREDGPAIERSDGYKKWYINGEQIQCSSNEEFLKLIKMKAFW